MKTSYQIQLKIMELTDSKSKYYSMYKRADNPQNKHHGHQMNFKHKFYNIKAMILALRWVLDEDDIKLFAAVDLDEDKLELPSQNEA